MQHTSSGEQIGHTREPLPRRRTTTLLPAGAINGVPKFEARLPASLTENTETSDKRFSGYS